MEEERAKRRVAEAAAKAVVEEERAKRQAVEDALDHDDVDTNRVPGGAPVFLLRNQQIVMDDQIEFLEQNGTTPRFVEVAGHELSWPLILALRKCQTSDEIVRHARR
eukprot:COSAG06_NODE_4860_length_3897_cov_5.800948_1_plen_107_part_00